MAAMGRPVMRGYTALRWYPVTSINKVCYGRSLAVKLFIKIALIACAHIAFLFLAYGSHFFAMRLPYFWMIALWIFGSSLMAWIVYWSTLSKSLLWSATSHRSLWFAICSTALMLVSLYIGVFLALNTFGT